MGWGGVLMMDDIKTRKRRTEPMDDNLLRIKRTPQHIPEGWWWLNKQGKTCFNEGKPTKMELSR